MATKLRIPESYFAQLPKFAELTPEELSDFVAAIRDQRPTLNVAALSRSLASRLSFDQDRINDIVRILARLQIVRETLDLSVSEFVGALRSAIEESGKPELHPSDWDAFQSSLSEILSGESALAISSKALRVMAEHKHVFCSAQVLTDLRPIFTAEVSRDPAAFVIIHTLKLTYHEGGLHKELFIALDHDDLDNLSTQLERAAKKETSLKALAAGKEIPVLEG